MIGMSYGIEKAVIGLLKAVAFLVVGIALVYWLAIAGVVLTVFGFSAFAGWAILNNLL